MIFVETDGILQERSDGRQSRAGISQWPSAPLVTSSLQNFLPTSGSWKQSFSMRIVEKNIVSHVMQRYILYWIRRSRREVIDRLDEDGKHWLCGKKAGGGSIRCGSFQQEGSAQGRTVCYSAELLELNSTRMERVDRQILLIVSKIDITTRGLKSVESILSKYSTTPTNARHVFCVIFLISITEYSFFLEAFPAAAKSLKSKSIVDVDEQQCLRKSIVDMDQQQCLRGGLCSAFHAD